ncbi:MAG: hypothetical protein Q4A48_04555 [Bacillota bacterium]|nr:hypothetical protein [Bacillota bacterium]
MKSMTKRKTIATLLLICILSVCVLLFSGCSSEDPLAVYDAACDKMQSSTDIDYTYSSKCKYFAGEETVSEPESELSCRIDLHEDDYDCMLLRLGKDRIYYKDGLLYTNLSFEDEDGKTIANTKEKCKASRDYIDTTFMAKAALGHKINKNHIAKAEVDDPLFNSEKTCRFTIKKKYVSQYMKKYFQRDMVDQAPTILGLLSTGARLDEGDLTVEITVGEEGYITSQKARGKMVYAGKKSEESALTMIMNMELTVDSINAGKQISIPNIEDYKMTERIDPLDIPVPEELETAD